MSQPEKTIAAETQSDKNSTETFLKIRKLTRLALPEDDSYLFRLGTALYGFNSINSFMIEIICHIDNTCNSIKLHDLESWKILDKFKQTLKNLPKWKLRASIQNDMESVAWLFEKLNTERSDFVHSYPITNIKNEQILHRRKDSKKKYFEVDNSFLNDFVSRLEEVSDLLYKIRTIVRPDL